MYSELDFLQMQSQGEYIKAKEINNMINNKEVTYDIQEPVINYDVRPEEVVQSKQERPNLVMPIAGDPTNGTSFPKEEKLVWSEMKRVINEMVENMAEHGNFRLLIPIWNKYDLEFLRCAEKNNVPVTFVLPTKSWGESQLPKFQTDLVIRMKARKENKVFIHRGKSFTERVEQGIKVADLIIGLDNGVGLEQFYNVMNESNGVIKPFPMNRMKFVTEEEGKALQVQQVQSSNIANLNPTDMLPGL